MARQVVGVDVGNYSFQPSANTITFIGLPGISLECIRLITDLNNNNIIYSFGTPNLGGTIFNGVLTLDLNVSAYSASDPLQIIIDMPSDSDSMNQVKIISDTPGQGPV